jgi:hypothetical protein
MPLGKNIVNVAAVKSSDFPEKVPLSVHRVIDELCPHKSGNLVDHPDSFLVVKHYTGTKEQFFFRDDPRSKLGGRLNFRFSTKDKNTQDDSMRFWLKGFTENVGKDAVKLLKGVGQLGYKEN